MERVFVNSKYILLSITVKEAVNENKFLVPKYQRSIVWGKKRCEAFMETVLKGDPFGVILVRENQGKYELVDGLQRITTLKNTELINLHF